MKIKLISAAIRSRSRWSQIMTLSLPAVAAATPEGHDISIEDERVKKIRLDDSPDLVGISYEVFRAYRAYDVADHYRKKHIPVILGGMHPSVMPEEALLHEKKFFMQSQVLLAENDELLLLSAKAGCIGVFVGIESVSAETLSEANKGFNRVDRLKNNIDCFRDRGIMVDGEIIFGFDTDTPDVFDRTIEDLEKIRIDSVAVNILILYSGTEFYRKFEREGRIICTDYTKYTENTVIIRPKNMTASLIPYYWFLSSSFFKFHFKYIKPAFTV